jgi:hypothetical protein
MNLDEFKTVEELAAAIKALGISYPVVNAKHFGAIGNGSTDDSASIQNAVDASMDGGLPLYFPVSDEIVTTGGAATDKLTIFGQGQASIIKLKDSSATNLFFVTTIDGLSVSDMTFDGNVSGAASSLGAFRVDIDDAHFRNCVFKDTRYEGVFFSPGSATQHRRLSVVGCTFIDCGRYGVAAENILDLVVADCIATGCGAGLVDVEPASAGDTSYRIAITGNVVTSTGTAVPAAGAIQVYGSNATHPSVRAATISGNVVTTTGGSGIEVGDAQEVAIIGNVIQGADRHGIYLPATTGNLYITVIGNVIKNVSQDTADTYDGINGANLRDCVITGNVINDTTSAHRYHLFLGSGCLRTVTGGNSYGAAAAQTGNESIGGSNNIWLPSAITARAFGVNDATPSVSGGQCFITANTSATTITNLDDGVQNQVVFIRVDDIYTTFSDGTNLKMAGGFSPNADDTISFMKVGGAW